MDAASTVVDQAWLQSPQRTFPVIVDPSVTIGLSGALGCYVASGGSPAALCSSSGSSDNPLIYGFTAYKRRIYLKFPEVSGASSPVPVDAQVTDAVLSMKVQSASNSTALDTDVHQPNGSWGSTITWANQPGTTPTPIQTSNVTPSGTVNFGVVYLAQRWINGQAVNNGVVIKKDDENTAVNTITFYGLANANRPSLVVTWVPRIGAQKSIAGYGHRLNDRLSLRVSYANRNLMLASTDVAWKAPGLSMNMTRYWNSLGAAQGLAGAFGQGWSMNGGYDVRLELGTFGATFVQPGGARIFFQRNAAYPEDDTQSQGYYTGRNGLNAQLRRVAGSSPTQYVMAFKQSKQLYTFTVDPAQPTVAYLTTTNDRQNGNSSTNTTASWGTPARVPATMTDSTGQRSLTFTNTDNAQGRVTAITENLAPGATGARTYNYGYDTNKHLTTYTDPAGKITRFCYTGDLITRVITPKGSDAGVTCTTTGTALVNTTDIAYNTDGKVTTVTYRLGTSPAITLTFDTPTALSRTATATGKTTFKDPYLQTTEYYFDAYDRVNKVVSPKGNTTTATFNTNDDVTASVSPINYTGSAQDITSTNTYDADNNLTSSTIPSGASTQAKYTNNLPTRISDDRDPQLPNDPARSPMEEGRQYNSGDGLLTQATKGSMKQKRIYEDATNCGPGGASGFPYALCEVQDAAYSSGAPTLHTTKYRYNAMGEVAAITPPNPGGSRATPADRTFTYDGFSRVKTSTNSRGQTTTYTYDALDRLTRQTYSDGTYTDLAYDFDGNLLTQTDKTSGGTTTASLTNGYDAMNRMVSEQPNGASANTVTWDGNSRMATFTDASGTMTYGYNEDSVLTSITLPGGNCVGVNPDNNVLPSVASRCIVYQRNPANQVVGIYWPGGLKQTYTYDNSGRVTHIVGMQNGSTTPELDQTYTYSSSTSNADTMHLRTRANAITNRTSTYDYTNEGWLYTETNRASGTTTVTSRHTFCYDANGNRTIGAFTAGAGSVTCSDPATSTWDGANQQLTGPTGTAADYAFDVDGNETSTGTGLLGSATRASTWNNRDQNTSNTIGAGSSLANTYLGAGNATPRTKQTSSGQNHQIRTSFTGITAVATSNGSTTTDVTYVRRDPAGNIVAFTNLAGDTFYPLTDRMGSIWVVLDQSGGTVYEVGSYAPYGQPTVTITNTSYTSLFGYLGTYTNPATGLVHFSARYYDPTLGRFTQTDPSSQERNPYAYTDNDPINRVDLTGLDFWDAASFVLGIGAAFATGGTSLLLTGASMVVGAIGDYQDDGWSGVAEGALIGAAGFGVSRAAGAGAEALGAGSKGVWATEGITDVAAEGAAGCYDWC